MLDTNIFVSAYMFNGFALRVYDHCMINDIVYVSPYLMQEFANKLRTKFYVEEAEIRSVQNLILLKTINATPQTPFPEVSNDYDDNNILQLADHVDAEFLITGDKGLLALQFYKNTRIVSPRYFYDHFIFQE